MSCEQVRSGSTTTCWACLLGVLAISPLAIAPAVPPSTDCANTHNDDADCDRWAKAGECVANPGFMKRSCQRSCNSCGWEDTYCTDKLGEPPASRGNTAWHVRAYIRAAPHRLCPPVGPARTAQTAFTPPAAPMM